MSRPNSAMKLAEAFFAGAIVLTDTNPDLARLQAESCLTILQRLPSGTAGDCATSMPVLGGVILPDFLHYELARQRFAEAGIVLD